VIDLVGPLDEGDRAAIFTAMVQIVAEREERQKVEKSRSELQARAQRMLGGR
jgi:hypothetical protein